MNQVKIAVLEKTLENIFFDLERLSNQELERF